jgi:hypothetical protein
MVVGQLVLAQRLLLVLAQEQVLVQVLMEVQSG